MPYLQTKTEPKCKLCTHPEREAAEAIIAQQQERKITQADCLAALAELGVENPTRDNIILHRKKHCQLVTAQEMEAHKKLMGEHESKALDMCDKQFGEGWQDRILTNDEYLTLLRIASQHDLVLKMQRGEKTGVTVDHGLKSVGEGTKRKQTEAESEMKLAMAHALESYASEHSRPALPPGVPEIIEGEVIDDPDN